MDQGEGFMMRKTLLVALTFLFILLIGSSCKPTPQPRPGDPFDGSAHWARDKALPLIASFAGDAQIYNVMGAQVMLDGRLPANLGTWSIVAWSPSRQEEFQVVVKNDGTTSTSTRAQASAPGANQQPAPGGWVNSTDVFNATTGHRDPGATLSTLAVFNITTQPRAVWGINFNAGVNQYVNWDGTYIGTTP
jgi:hypothetical protein